MIGRKGAARRAVLDALNGDIDSINAAVRRALVALAQTHDESEHDFRIAIEGLNDLVETAIASATERFNESMDRIDKRVTVMTRLLISTAVTLLTTTIAVMMSTLG